MVKTFLFIITMLISVHVNALSINSFNISTATVKAMMKTNSNCLRYHVPTHFCLWAAPPQGRKITPVLDHYLPDLVVVVYRNNDENPWTEAKLLIDKLNAAIQEKVLPNVGSGNHSFADASEQQVIFKEADVIGNPALLTLPRGFVLLPSTALPMNPYFQSMADSFLWRGFMPQAAAEETASVVLGEMHHVGTGLVNWGGVYPHEGAVMNMDDLKASMVIAQRATDLLTNEKTFGHLHQTLLSQCGQHCQSSPIQENSEETLFQMVYPIEQTSCSALGSDESYDESMHTEDGAYVWVVWRHYKGCEDGDGKFIGVV